MGGAQAKGLRAEAKLAREHAAGLMQRLDEMNKEYHETARKMALEGKAANDAAALSENAAAKSKRIVAELEAVKAANDQQKEELSAKVQQLTIEKEKRETELQELLKSLSGKPVSARVSERMSAKVSKRERARTR